MTDPPPQLGGLSGRLPSPTPMLNASPFPLAGGSRAGGPAAGFLTDTDGDGVTQYRSDLHRAWLERSPSLDVAAEAWRPRPGAPLLCWQTLSGPRRRHFTGGKGAFPVPRHSPRDECAKHCGFASLILVAAPYRPAGGVPRRCTCFEIQLPGLRAGGSAGAALPLSPQGFFLQGAPVPP